MSTTSSDSNTLRTPAPPSAVALVARGLLWGVAMGVGLAIGGPVGAAVVGASMVGGGGN